MIDWFWVQGVQAGHKNTLDCIKAFSETDFRQDLEKIDVPTLVIHGDDDQIVPITVGGLRSSNMIKDATLKVYEGAPHGLMSTHQQRFNADLLAFVRQSALAGASRSR
jgi:non-heme chloroperoxidase